MALWKILPIGILAFPLFAAEISDSDVGLPMPNLSNMVLRTDRQVHNSGKIIKGLYYGLSGQKEHAAVAFHNACHLVLEKLPFLIVIFDLSRSYFDADRDGITDKVSSFADEIDPADFYILMPDADSYCRDPGTES
jgi:hypothetical protein